MDASGPGPSGPGPDASEVEAARRRMYRPDATAEDDERYARLVAAAARREPVEERQPADDVAPEAIDLPTAARPAWRRIALGFGAGIVVLAGLVVLLLPHGEAPLPEFLAPPSAAGTTLTTLARLSDPRTAPDLVTYTPQGYTVFQPEGRAVRVALRCQGPGRVVIAAGRRFAFRCGAGVRVLHLTGPATSTPFVVIGITRGNVVWAARITAS